MKLRRLLPLTPLAPAVALILFAAANAAAEGGDENALQDVQVGEEGRLMRIALICSEDCGVGARAGGAFFLNGVDAHLNVDLAGRSVHARAIAIEPAEGGSLVRLDASEAISKASIKPCLIDGLTASCIDIEFGSSEAPQKVAAPVEAAARKEATAKLTVPEPPKAILASGSAPALREAPKEEILSFARFAPPERLEPPAQRPIINKEKAAGLLKSNLDIGETASALLDRRFGVGECEGAQARLRTDAWALEAMVDVGFCTAIAGDLDKASGVFQRLLDYTPDNYEALVGRALIAAKSGDKNQAKKYFQDALNSLPPIAESDRIVALMAKL